MAEEVINRFTGKHRFLSNFWLCKPHTIYLSDEPERWYRSVEHAYQAAKHALWARQLFHEVQDPGEAKRMGGSATPTFHDVKLELMLHLLRQKFGRDPMLSFLLKQTGEVRLVEGNTWHDSFWGRCACTKCFNKTGQNHLGRLLEQVRKELNEAGQLQGMSTV